ncbi:site-specific integrase [Actinoplanes cyaneus]|uniref:Site-specific integrase n=1 Tax=Actinoplanes cyaneus TaxID=52696 RepID=A0A919IJB0_9ACTN|nr:site-specific integrase [Actinoplanes cyaneus]MCW2138858.1 Phage integrase, N-terminal SAM-like domain [Actinoplanes cyaneus]GID66804.1 site-specific integrase [Actinoplanes cyaneus]
MTTTNGIFKKCGCTDNTTGRRCAERCPRLPEPGHGSWYFACSTHDLLGNVERIRRGGYPSEEAAQQARDALLAISLEERTGQNWTVTRWLRYWLTTRTRIRPTTRAHYTHDIDRFLIPTIGHLTLAELNPRQLTAAFAAIGKSTNRHGRPNTVCTLQHVHTTLRAALNAALRDGVILANPATRVELPARDRPRAEVWTEPRVAAWRATGEHPVVAVWTAKQLAEFLHSVRHDGLYALWWLLALRGLRRGEAAGLRWTDIDLDHAQLTVTRQRTTAGYTIHEGPPKSATSRRIVALDQHTVQVLRLHRRRQERHHIRRDAAAKPYLPSGYVFTRPDGAPFHPGYFTQRLQLLIDRAGLPPVRLQDLRHGAASLAHSAGADLKTIQDLLGHSNVALTADVYTNVLPATQRRAAEETARLILTAGRTRRVCPVLKRTMVRPRTRLCGTPADVVATRSRAARISAAARRSSREHVM